jgi:chromosome segregation ATPase
MALNLKDLAKKPETEKKTKSGALGQGKKAARPWEVESWEKPAMPVEAEVAGVSTSSDEPTPVEAFAVEETPAPDEARDAPMDASAADSAAMISEEAVSQERVPAHRREERRGSRTAATEEKEPDLGVDDVLAFVEDLKLKLKNSQKSKRALEEILTASKTKMEEVEALAAERSMQIVKLNQAVARLTGENEQQLAELCRADDDRAEAALVLKRLKVNLSEMKTQICALEEQNARLQAELAKARQSAMAREEQVAASEAENAQRWHKFEEQLNQKDREIFKARAMIDELKHFKAQAEARVAQFERSRAAIEKIRTAVQLGREPNAIDPEG